jgi:hypothetical protein
MAKLTGKQYEALQNALIDAFPSPDLLARRGKSGLVGARPE